MEYHILIYIIILISALMSVMSEKMLNSAIMLSVMSIGVSLLLFNFKAPIAGFFELSVCAGLITVLFISAVSLVKQEDESLKEKKGKFIILPLLILAYMLLGYIYLINYFNNFIPYSYICNNQIKVGEIIWKYRLNDLIGQLLLLLTAVFVIKSIFTKKENLEKEK